VAQFCPLHSIRHDFSSPQPFVSLFRCTLVKAAALFDRLSQVSYARFRSRWIPAPFRGFPFSLGYTLWVFGFFFADPPSHLYFLPFFPPWTYEEFFGLPLKLEDPTHVGGDWLAGFMSFSFLSFYSPSRALSFFV